MIWTCVQKFRTLSSIDICKQIFLHLISYNFLPWIIAKMMMWSSFLGRATYKDSHKIYFINLWHLFIFLQILESYTNFCEYIKYYEIRKWMKNEKLRVTRIRPEAKALLGVVAYYGSRPSRPHDPTGTAQQPLDPAGSGAPPVVTVRWRPTGWQGVGKLAGTARARKGEGAGQGGTGGDAPRRRCDDEATVRRRGGGVDSGRRCSSGGAAPAIVGVLSSCTGVNRGVRVWL
jgi:hypothetical protein